jgi:hypothetical protein
MNDWERVNAWTLTLYTLIQSLHVARKVQFGDLAALEAHIIDARAWSPMESSYASILLDHPFGKSRITFRRDPEKHFEDTVAQFIQMLAQDLVVIFDAMMDGILASRGEAAGRFPQSKVEKLATHLDPKHDWARQGCLELIAARNVLTHSGGLWNKKSITIVSSFVKPPPAVGEKLQIGFPMLFRYRKAMRTFLNEVQQ